MLGGCGWGSCAGATAASAGAPAPEAGGELRGSSRSVPAPPARLELTHAEPQAALVALANDKELSERQRSAAAYSLIATQWPDARSIDALIGWLEHDTLSEYALYGLGTFSRHLRAAGQIEASKRAAEALLAELPRSQHTRRVHVLRGIANSGYPGAFEAVRPLLNDKDESIRAAAIESIRLMDRPEVDGILVEQLKVELALNLRLAALNAASVRSPSDALVRGVSELATGAPEAQSRLKAVQLLERWLRARPDVRPTLQQVADNEDEREGVRRAAQAALAGLTGGRPCKLNFDCATPCCSRPWDASPRHARRSRQPTRPRARSSPQPAQVPGRRPRPGRR
ncbi:HEAT repeat domain-containing protein [Sorangium sp. So ce119]|uniref:HEAT repeat domain-containing protein n=1 Tax=Sorangium sp. So ce119 TaxID=3133279 RepID=UPI003F5EFF75